MGNLRIVEELERDRCYEILRVGLLYFVKVAGSAQFRSLRSRSLSLLLLFSLLLCSLPFVNFALKLNSLSFRTKKRYAKQGWLQPDVRIELTIFACCALMYECDALPLGQSGD